MIPFAIGFYRKEVEQDKCHTTFDGINEYVVVSGNDKYSFIQNTAIFSISLWIKLNDYTASGNQFTLGNNGGTTGKKGFWLGYQGSSNDRLRLVVTTGGGSSNVVIRSNSANNAIQDNDWHHLVVSCNGTNAFFYIDNVKQTGSDTVNILSTGETGRTLRIGHITEFGGGGYVNGALDEVAIFNDTLTDLEVNEIFLQGRFEANYTGINGVYSHWKMSALNPKDEIIGDNGVSFNMDSSNIACE